MAYWRITDIHIKTKQVSLIFDFALSFHYL